MLSSAAAGSKLKWWRRTSERGRAAHLNFGHTFGHAIERLQGYGEWLHGEAVAAGMVIASRLSVDREALRRWSLTS